MKSCHQNQMRYVSWFCDAGRDWGQEEKGTTEDEMAGWHHWLDGRESGWTLWVGDGQGGLACCDSWGRKESDTTEQLNWTELNIHTRQSFTMYLYVYSNFVTFLFFSQTLIISNFIWICFQIFHLFFSGCLIFHSGFSSFFYLIYFHFIYFIIYWLR